MYTVRQASPFQSMVTPYFYHANNRPGPLQNKLQISLSAHRARSGSISQNAIQSHRPVSNDRQTSTIVRFQQWQNELLKSTSQGQLLQKVEGSSMREGHKCLASARSDSKRVLVQNNQTQRAQTLDTKISEEYFEQLKNKYRVQCSNIRNRVASKNKENPKREPSKSQKNFNILIPTVHSSNQPSVKQSRDPKEGFLKDLLGIVLIDKELLKNQWLMFQKYEAALKTLVGEIMKMYNKDMEQHQSNILNSFIGINVIKRLFTYVDIQVEESQLHKLFPFTNQQSVTPTEIEAQVLEVFLSPSFFIKRTAEQTASNLAEMQRVMKTIVTLTIRGQDHFKFLKESYSSKELKQAKVFESLTSEKILNPKSLSEHLPEACKPDYCLHLLHRINPANCLQVTKESFYRSFA